MARRSLDNIRGSWLAIIAVACLLGIFALGLGSERVRTVVRKALPASLGGVKAQEGAPPRGGPARRRAGGGGGRAGGPAARRSSGRRCSSAGWESSWQEDPQKEKGRGRHAPPRPTAAGAAPATPIDQGWYFQPPFSILTIT